MPRTRESDRPRSGQLAPSTAQQRGLLAARPAAPSLPAPGLGRQPLRLSTPRDGFIYVPATLDAARTNPLVVFFHGAGGDAAQADMILPWADQHGLLLLALDSRSATWDAIGGELGPDVAFVELALRWTFERYGVDTKRVAASGFSDGASYALSLGLANGDLFSHVLAFSPGFAAPPQLRGKPLLFVSHGTRDTVLPIDACSRRLVPRFNEAGYDVQYREFSGGHTVPLEIARDAFAWFAR